MRYLCLKCNSVFFTWGKKPGRYGGFKDCCPSCGNNEMTSIKRNFGFGWTKLTKNGIKLIVCIFGIVVLLIGFVLCLFIAYALVGLALMSIGTIITLISILVKSDK